MCRRELTQEELTQKAEARTGTRTVKGRWGHMEVVGAEAEGKGMGTEAEIEAGTGTETGETDMGAGSDCRANGHEVELETLLVLVQCKGVVRVIVRMTVRVIVPVTVRRQEILGRRRANGLGEPPLTLELLSELEGRLGWRGRGSGEEGGGRMPGVGLGHVVGHVAGHAVVMEVVV
jgi:hypothetical protein